MSEALRELRFSEHRKIGLEQLSITALLRGKFAVDSETAMRPCKLSITKVFFPFEKGNLLVVDDADFFSY